MKSYNYNSYFIIQLPEPALAQILSHCIERTIDKIRKLYDGSYIVKLPMHAVIPEVLKNKTAYSHSEALIEIAKREIGRPQI